MNRVRQLSPDYQGFGYQAAIDMFDNVGSGMFSQASLRGQ